ncbi:MAG: alanine racemase [Termitinemataceae bacterium]|nr:MAG: alanine racemase [Termitinemataceae bacterium]
MRATRAIIHLDNLIHNINVLREHLHSGGSDIAICLPVKADAYGHGALEIAQTALENGVTFLAIATVDEGVELRDAGINAPILLLSQCTPSETQYAADNNLIPLVSDKEAAKLFSQAAQKSFCKDGKVDVFLKIDTGMGRMGCAPENAAELAEYIISLGNVNLAGTITHFAVSDSTEDAGIAYTNLQLEKFTGALNAIQEAGISTGIVTAANTGATIANKRTWFDMVRPGILLYGYPPDGLEPQIPVKPVMELVTQIVFLKKIKEGESVSYGRTWTAEKDTVVGIIPVGYADGLPRALSNNFRVFIKDNLFPLAGRICMDQCMVDLGNAASVQRWDEVSIFGGEGSFTAADIARQNGTISYEITCNINKRVRRIYTS